ncbi:uncharacterized protein LOC111308184 [Durio zibethinus]|uniref:Uncharacterized protein LOC111308184 n=1 Tax=Durio zibethinus TaxID=66656 RepID=A0A6P6ABQ6_DURZI|nr:uncharacterized protein LOC111308184 [Durio zibethinus]
MKTYFAFFIFCFLLLFANLNHATNEWKSVMKDQPMPEAIKALLHQDPASGLDSEKMKHFVKDFDSKHSFIIYHSNPEYKEEDKTHVKDLKNQKQRKSDKKN